MKTLQNTAALAVGCWLAGLRVEAQYSITSLETFTLETFPGYTAAGLVPSPGAGQLDSDSWIVHGLADPVNFGGTPADIRREPPLLGEHTVEVLLEIGFSQADAERIATDAAAKAKK